MSYDARTWVRGDIITAESLNKIEHALEGLDQRLANLKFNTVTFKTYNDSDVIATAIVIGGVPQFIPPIPERESSDEYSYEGVGWNKKVEQSTHDESALRNITKNITVYAAYVAKLLPHEQ